jgi:hypothetical protein
MAWVRLGLRVSNDALHVLGAGQQGLIGRDKSRDCYLVYAGWLTKA